LIVFILIVFEGLAILNPSAKQQIRQYSKSVSTLFRMMIQEQEEEFNKRIREVVLSSEHVEI